MRTRACYNNYYAFEKRERKKKKVLQVWLLKNLKFKTLSLHFTSFSGDVIILLSAVQ